MKGIALFAAAMLLSFSAAAQEASDATVERLMTITRAEKTVETLRASLDSIMDGAMKSAVTEPLPPEQQRKLDAGLASIKDTIRSEFSWDKLKPRYVKLYKETFTDAEIEGLIAFYESPAGQAFLAKMPVLMQNAIAMNQEMMRAMIPRMKSSIQEAVAQAKAGS